MNDQIEARRTDRGWLAILPARGLAAHAKTREEAIREVREALELVQRLAARWSGSEATQASTLDRNTGR
jgi:hypothetical protein